MLVRKQPDDLIEIGKLYLDAEASGVILGHPAVDGETGELLWDHPLLADDTAPAPLKQRLVALETLNTMFVDMEDVTAKVKTDEFDEDTIANIAGVFPQWGPGLTVAPGEVYSWDSTLVEVRQGHTTQADWTPDVTPALWKVHRTQAAGDLVWIPGIDVEVDEEFTYNQVRYRVVQSHTTQVGWEPDTTPAMWAVVVPPAPETPDTEWQPGTSVFVGDEVTWQGQWYRALLEHTTQTGWEPPATPALWEAFTPSDDDDDDETPVDDDDDSGGDAEPGDDDAYPEWVQPTGGHNAYNIGDRVTFEGGVYESTMNGNTWSPTDYPQGWALVE